MDRLALLRRSAFALAVGLCLPALVALPAVAAPSAADAKAAAADQDWEKAAEAWAGVLQAKAGDREATLGLGTAVHEGRVFAYLADADRAARALTQKDEKDGEAWELRGELALLSTEAPGAGSTAKMAYADAEEHFGRALEANADLEGAAVGVARVHFLMGRTQEALDALGAYLGRNTKTQAKALFWQGEIRYRQALAAHREAGGAYPVQGQARQLFEQARGSFMASTKADPSRVVAWVELGYTCQYLQDVDGAAEAYEAAARLAPQNDAALKGLAVVLTYDRPRYVATLEKILQAKPKHAMAAWYLAQVRLQDGDTKKALAALQIAAENLRNPAAAWVQMGDVELKAGNRAGAEKAWKKALEVDPANELAAFHLETPLREGGMQKAASSVAGAKELIADYEKLLKLAPRNTLLLNNLAFILREAHAQHKGDSSWKPILEASRDMYVRAADIVGEYTAQYEGMAMTERLSRAQVISDTGLMFQFYPEIQDLERAERYYLSALDWSDNGYFDAYNNLVQIWNKAERWDDLYDLADVAAESLLTNEGAPHPGRGSARALADRLVKEKKVDR
ncbi:MAG: tetratricopeptide repeat protein [Planctomycetes bacterium]|nr:tetratricopeptide repeat protein [Planctomycetota bacterium]